MESRKKMGRPTDSKKDTQISIRLDDETLRILDDYCFEEKITRPDGIRTAVKKLKKK